MNPWGKTILCFLLVLPAAAQSLDIDHFNGPETNINFELCQTTRQKALKQRGVKVTRDKDDLVRRTVRAYGGDYVRNGETAAITLNGKTYQDFTIEIVEGKYLRIKTSDDTLYLEVVDKP